MHFISSHPQFIVRQESKFSLLAQTVKWSFFLERRGDEARAHRHLMVLSILRVHCSPC